MRKRTLGGPRGAKTQRGMGLVVTMLVLMGILAVTLIGTVGVGGSHGYKGILGMTDNALQSSTSRTRAAASFNMAESGIQYTMAWLSTRAAPPNNNTAFAPTGWGFVTLNNRGCVTPDANNPTTYFAVRIYPDAYNSVTSSPTSNNKKYLIESEGISGGVTTTVQTYVSQISLAQYLVLLNTWNNSGNYWVSGLTTFDGPVHDNNANGLPENVLWKSANGTSPMFTYTGNDAYTTSGANGISWWKDSFFQQGTPQVVTNSNGTQTNQWLNVAAGGAGTIHTGTPVVPFPTSSALQRNAAVNSAATNSTGVTLCPGGGIYIEGNVSEMALSTTGNNNTSQVITVTQNPPVTATTVVQQIVINPSLNTTTLSTQGVDANGNKVWIPTTVMSGTTNGVVYCDGNIGAQGDPKTGGLHGQVADNLLDGNGNVLHDSALTVATPQNDNCNLDGSVTYNTSRQVAKDASGNPEYIDVNGNPTSDPTKGTPVYVSEDQDPNFVSKAGTLGLISNNILVTVNDSNNNPLTKFEMDGTVLASSLYDADHWDSRAVGLWENMGGYLSSNVGTFGMFDGNTLQLTNGFNTQFNYDARMRNNPPPFFPTTGSTYKVVSWRQPSGPLEP